MTKDTILEIMHPIFLDVFELEEINLTENTSAAEIEQWDSLTHIQLVVALEKKLNIRFNAAEIQNWKNVGEIVEGIQAKL